MVERKSDGVEKRSLQLFTESLSITLQTALLFLTRGHCRGTCVPPTPPHAQSSLRCTCRNTLVRMSVPASAVLWCVKSSGTTRKLLESPPPPKVILLVYTTWRNTRKLLLSLNQFNATPPGWTSTMSPFRHPIAPTMSRGTHRPGKGIDVTLNSKFTTSSRARRELVWWVCERSTFRTRHGRKTNNIEQM